MKSLFLVLIIVTSVSAYSKCRVDIINNLEEEILDYNVTEASGILYIEEVSRKRKFFNDKFSSNIAKKITYSFEEPVAPLLIDKDTGSLTNIPVILEDGSLASESIFLTNKRVIEEHTFYDALLFDKKVIFVASEECFEN